MLIAVLLLISGGAVGVFAVPYGERLPVIVFTVFLVDALGGPWLGYAALAAPCLALLNDPSSSWAAVLPLVLASLFVGLLARHQHPSWLGAAFAFGAFLLPLIAFIALQGRLQVGSTSPFNLPLGETRALGSNALSAGVALFISGFVATLRESRSLARATATRRPARP